MGLLNMPTDGLPSVLFALVRSLRHFGPMPRSDLLAICCPPTLQNHTPGFERDRFGQKTLLRWTQFGLFFENGDTISLHESVTKMPTEPIAEVRAIGTLLRRLALGFSEEDALEPDREDRAADLCFALSWMLAQDIQAVPGGAYANIEGWEASQFGSPPYAFQNDTRWNGFRAWAPLLGFGWTEAVRGNAQLVIDPTDAIRDEIPLVFDSAIELPIKDFVQRLARLLPVLDGGDYRQRVEARLNPEVWRATNPNELSVSLSVALKRLHEARAIRLESRADAPKRALLRRGHHPWDHVSHVVRGGAGDA